MVVRLGQTSEVQVVNSQRYRVKQGQALGCRYVSSQSVTLRGWARVRYDNGEDDLLFIPDQALSNDRAVTLLRSSDVARMDGWITDALVELPLDQDIKRGQVYVKLFMDPFGAVLCSDYCSSSFGQVTLGTYIQPGPGGGAGYLHVEVVKAASAPDATTTFNLPLSNMVRKVSSFSWLYECSNDVASRELDVYLNDFLGVPPVGMGGRDRDAWHPAQLVLTADQDGCMFGDADRSGKNDNAVIAIDAEATPFPLWVPSDAYSAYKLQFLVNNEEVLDNDAIYLLIEDWVYLGD